MVVVVVEGGARNGGGWMKQTGGRRRADEGRWGGMMGGEGRRDRRETGTVEFIWVQSKWREMKRFRDTNVYNETLWSHELIQVAHTEALTCLFFSCFSEIEFRCFFSPPIPSYNDINKADWTENWPDGGKKGGLKRKEAVNRPTGACKQIPSRHGAAGTCAKVAVTKLLRGDLRTHAIATCSSCCRTRLLYMRSAGLSHCSMDEGRCFLTGFTSQALALGMHDMGFNLVTAANCWW